VGIVRILEGGVGVADNFSHLQAPSIFAVGWRVSDCRVQLCVYVACGCARPSSRQNRIARSSLCSQQLRCVDVAPRHVAVADSVTDGRSPNEFLAILDVMFAFMPEHPRDEDTARQLARVEAALACASRG
jgi:hypothetical protein